MVMVWPFNRTVKAAPRPDNNAPIQPEIMYLSSGMAVGIIKWNDRVAAQSAMTHPIVYRAIDKLASSVQQTRWFVEEDPSASATDRRGKKTMIADLQYLLDHPNNEMTPAMLRYWMTMNYALYGRVPYKVSYGAIDPSRPNGIYPLEAASVLAVQNSRGVVERYEYGLGTAKEIYPSRATADIGKSCVDQIWKPGLKGYQARDDQNTPMNSIGLPAQVIRSLLIRAIQTAEGHPNVKYMVTCSKTLTEPQRKALGEFINQDHSIDGPDSGRVPILQNAGDIVIHKLDNDLSDIHTKTPSDDMSRLIFGAFGIPIALAGMGAADGAKFAGNYVESRAAFWQDTVVPMYVEPLFQGLSRSICPAGLRISADLDSIPAMMEGRILSMAKLKDVDFLSADEKRELFGWSGNQQTLEGQ